MGNGGSRVIQVQDIQEQLTYCQRLQYKNCPIYGAIQYVQYNGMKFYIGQSFNLSPPHPQSIHYLIPPNLLIISEFKLLEETNPTSLDQLLQIISRISEMACNGGDIGIGYGRIGYAGRWGVVGQQSIDWAYKQIFQNGGSEGIFLSPQLMTALSQGKKIPKHSVEKSDVFALGIMLVQIIFQQKLSFIFDYQNLEINLKPLLQKLDLIRSEYGDKVYQIFLSMLEIQQTNRAGFAQIFDMTEQIRKSQPRMINSRMTSSNHSRDMQRGNRTPTRGGKYPNGVQKSPVRQYGNNLSPFRARLTANNRGPQPTGRTPERNRIRQQQTSRSPLRRDLKINTQFGRESNNNYNFGMNENVRRPLSPISRR